MPGTWHFIMKTWEKVTHPLPWITDETERQRSHVISLFFLAYSLFGLFIVVPILPFAYAETGLFSTPTLHAATTFVWFTILYLLSRTRIYKVTPYIAVISVWVSSFWGALTLTSSSAALIPMLNCTLAIIMSGIIMSARRVVIYSIGTLLVVLLLPYFFAEVPQKRGVLLANLSIVQMSYFALGAYIMTSQMKSIAAEKKRAEELANIARSSRERVRSLLNQAADMILILLPNGRVRDANKMIQKTLGYEREQLRAKSLADLDSSGEFQRLLTDTNLANLAPITRQGELTGDGGKHVPVELRLAHTHAVGENLFLAMFRDMTEQRRREQLIEQQRLQLFNAAKMSSLGTMAASIARELKTPLTVIQRCASTIRDNVDDPEQSAATAEHVRAIDQAVTFMADLVSTLREFARDDSSDEPRLTNVKEVVERTLIFCHEKLQRQGVELKVTGLAPHQQILVHPNQIAQILLNLIGNAADVISLQGNQWIEVKVTEGSQYYDIEVVDSGPGIGEEDPESLFTPFFTTKANDSRQGIGIGLSVSRNLARSNGGDLFFATETAHTTFRLRLPTATTA